MGGIVLASRESQISQLKKKCLSLCLPSLRGTDFSSQLIIYETKNRELEGLFWPCPRVRGKGERSTFSLVMGKQGSHLRIFWES